MSEQTSYVSRNKFLSLAKEGQDQTQGTGLRKAYIPDSVEKVEDKAAKNPERVYRFTISTDSVDRDADTIATRGWRLAAYRKNPVVLFGHDGRSLPIARASKIKVEDNALKADAEFITSEVDTSGRSEMIFRMVKEGFLKATSVGFLPLKYEFCDTSEEGNENRQWGIDFKEQELLEFSIVPVPANPECLVEAGKKSIDLKILHDYLEEILDEWDVRGESLLVPKKLAEKSYNVIKRTRKPLSVPGSLQDDLLNKNLERIRSQEDDMSETNKSTPESEDKETDTDTDKTSDKGEGEDSNEEVTLSSQMEEIKEILASFASDVKSGLSELKEALVPSDKGEEEGKGGGDDDDDEDDDDKGGGSDDDEDDDDDKSPSNFVTIERDGIKTTISCEDPELTVKLLQAANSAPAETPPKEEKEEKITPQVEEETGDEDKETLDLLKELLPGIVSEVVGEKFSEVLDKKRGKVK